MSRKCSIEGCENPVFGKNCCKRHYPKTPLKKGGIIKKVSEKQKEKNIEKKEWFSKLHKWMEELWNRKPHYCQSCNRWLGNEFKTIYEDHLICKSLHPELAFEEENIFITCSEHHSAKEMGFPTKKHKEAIEKAKIRFGIN